MKEPYLGGIPTEEKTLKTFGGLNRRAKISENEFSDMQNLSGDGYPVLTSRKGRSVRAAGVFADGMVNKDALCYASGGKLYVNGYEVPGLVLGSSEKQFVSMGAYLVIFPDKKWVNTKDLTDYGSIDASFTTGSPVTYTMCLPDASPMGTPTVSATAPSDPGNGDLWIDTSASPHVLKRYSESTAVWSEVATTYIKISSENIARDFSEGDAVSISGSEAGIDGDGIYVERAYHGTDGAGDYIVVSGILDAAVIQTAAMTVSRRMPAVDFVTECNNRIWGCRYGVDNAGRAVNEIYACKLGDFKNWNCFRGLSTDSYAASLGSDGPFTAAVTYLGYPMFWKEECFHKVYGDYPANFRVGSTVCDGVAKGCHRSVAVVNSALIYCSPSGFFLYDGSLPENISAAVGGGYSGAAAGAVGTKYYVSAAKDRAYSILVYDTATGMWHREDALRVFCFCTVAGRLYAALSDGISEFCDDSSSETVSWYFISGLFGTDTAERRYPSRLTLRLHLGGSATVYIEYDRSGTWTEAAAVTGTAGTADVVLRMRRCECSRIKVAGSGALVLYSITRTFYGGSKKP